MTANSHYIIDPHPDENEIRGFLIDAGTDSLSVKGKIISAPKGLPGKSGDPVCFQYNSHFESVKEDGLMFLDPSLLYSVGPYCVNDWVMIKMHNPPRASIIMAPVDFPVKKHTQVIINPRLAHRLLPEIFNSDPIYMIKRQYILMIAK